MKKFFAMMLFAFAANANAALITIDVNGPTEVEAGDVVSFTVTGDFDNAIDLLSFDLLFDVNLFDYDFTSFTTNWPNDDYGVVLDTPDLTRVLFDFVAFIDVSGPITLASFDLIALDSGVAAFDATVRNAANSITGDNFTASTPIEINQVSAPATLGMLLIAGALVALRRRA